MKKWTKVMSVIVGTEVIRLEACPLCGNLDVKFKQYKPYDGYMNEGENYQISCECGMVYERSASQVSLSDFCSHWNFGRRVPTNYEWLKNADKHQLTMFFVNMTNMFPEYSYNERIEKIREWLDKKTPVGLAGKGA